MKERIPGKLKSQLWALARQAKRSKKAGDKGQLEAKYDKVQATLIEVAKYQPTTFVKKDVGTLVDIYASVGLELTPPPISNGSGRTMTRVRSANGDSPQVGFTKAGFVIGAVLSAGIGAFLAPAFGAERKTGAMVGAGTSLLFGWWSNRKLKASLEAHEARQTAHEQLVAEQMRTQGFVGTLTAG